MWNCDCIIIFHFYLPVKFRKKKLTIAKNATIAHRIFRSCSQPSFEADFPWLIFTQFLAGHDDDFFRQNARNSKLAALVQFFGACCLREIKARFAVWKFEAARNFHLVILCMYCVLYYILGPLRSYKESQNHSSSSEKENNIHTYALVNSEKIFLWEGVLKTLQK